MRRMDAQKQLLGQSRPQSSCYPYPFRRTRVTWALRTKLLIAHVLILVSKSVYRNEVTVNYFKFQMTKDNFQLINQDFLVNMKSKAILTSKCEITLIPEATEQFPTENQRNDIISLWLVILSKENACF